MNILHYGVKNTKGPNSTLFPSFCSLTESLQQGKVFYFPKCFDPGRCGGHSRRGRKLGSRTFDLGHEAQTLLEVGADAVEAPAELGVAAILVGAAGVVARVQLVAALGHGRDAHVHLADNREDLVC